MPYNALAAAVRDTINQRRQAALLPGLEANAALTTAAQAYAELHVATTLQLSHYLDAGPGDRAQRAGYSGSAGEVLVLTSGPAMPGAIVDVWMGSPPHWAVLMGAYQDIGTGCAVAGVTLCVGLVGLRY